MSKNPNKRNITTIIHDLKEDYAKCFHEKAGLEMEDIIILAAREVKKGMEAHWYKDEKTGAKKLRISRREKRSYVERPKNNLTKIPNKW